MNEHQRRVVEHELSRRGVLSWLLLPHQEIIHEHVKNNASKTVTVENCSRQIGKSFVAAVIAVEHALQKPDQHVLLVTDSRVHMAAIVEPKLNLICSRLAPDVMPEQAGYVWTFKNGSIIRLEGLDSGHAESCRGLSNDLVIIDEAGFVSDLEYVVNDIIRPSFIKTKGRMIVISTPSPEPGHFFDVLMSRARVDGSYLELDVYKNGFATQAEIERWKDEAGGEDSSTWKREYLCQSVRDSNLVVIPEAETFKLVKTEPPTKEELFVSMDTGVRDRTHVCLGYYDFKRAKMVIQSELNFTDSMRTDQLAIDIIAEMKRLWVERKPRLQVTDVDPRLINELNVTHGMSFRVTSKATVAEMVNELRIWLSSGRIEIDESCKQLHEDMKNAVWEPNRKTWKRTADGHCDGLASIMYAVRNIKSISNINPFPKGESWQLQTHHWNIFKKDVDADVNEDDDVAALNQLF